jgi:hypothetical protein
MPSVPGNSQVLTLPQISCRLEGEFAKFGLLGLWVTVLLVGPRKMSVVVGESEGIDQFQPCSWAHS